MTVPVALWPDVVGTIELRLVDEHADFFSRNEFAVLVEQDRRPFPPIAGWFLIPRAMIEDPGVNLLELVRANLEHVFRPWAFPDPVPIPKIELFPRLVKLTRPVRWFWRELLELFEAIRFGLR